MGSKKIACLISGLLVFGAVSVSAANRFVAEPAEDTIRKSVTLNHTLLDRIDAVPPEIEARFSSDVIAKLPPAVWRGVVAQHIDPSILAPMEEGDEAAEECPPLDFSIRFNEAECKAHGADACGDWFEGDCDGGFRDGEPVVDPDQSSYIIVWKARNAILVMDNCHSYSQLVPNFDFDADSVHWAWDGPLPNSAVPAGYSAALDQQDRGNGWGLVPESLGMISDAYAWGKETVVYHDRKGGRFDCKAFALGKCWQYKEIPYSYSCTRGGVEASPQ